MAGRDTPFSVTVRVTSIITVFFSVMALFSRLISSCRVLFTFSGVFSFSLSATMEETSALTSTFFTVLSLVFIRPQTHCTPCT